MAVATPRRRGARGLRHPRHGRSIATGPLLDRRWGLASLGSLPRAVVAQVIVEQEPARPSASVDAVRAWELRGDLDAIILQALEKEPERRYRSAEALSEDLGRFLEGLPVAARGRGLPYVAGKLLWRYWVAVAAAAGVFGVGRCLRRGGRAVGGASRAGAGAGGVGAGQGGVGDGSTGA